MYDLLIAIHVLAAVIWVGGGASLHVIARRALKRGDSEEIYKLSKELIW